MSISFASKRDEICHLLMQGAIWNYQLIAGLVINNPFTEAITMLNDNNLRIIQLHPSTPTTLADGSTLFHVTFKFNTMQVSKH